MYFLILKETFVAIPTLIANSFDKVKIIKFKGQLSTVNVKVNCNVSLNNYL